MKILFDYKIFYQQKYGGISNYFFNLAKELIKLDQEILFSVPIYKNEYITNLSKQYIYGYKIKYLPHNLNFFFDKFNYYFNQKKIQKFAPNIVHESYYSNKDFIAKKKICTVYDMINEKFPEYFLNHKKISEMKKKTLDRADHIICISNNTKNDLIDYFNIDENKISVIYLASSFKKKINLERKLDNKLLFIGSRLGYKNFENLIKAYSSSDFIKKNFQIIAYGGERFNSFDKKILNENNLTLKNVEYIDDRKFSPEYLFSNVAAFIFPSIYEGFGIPVLEAMKCGCPVISSNGGSLKEVGGKNLEYFDPHSIEDIKNKIEKMLISQSLQKKTIENGYVRANEFSWQKCAEKTLEVYKKVHLK